jgi:hypothetical protein
MSSPAKARTASSDSQRRQFLGVFAPLGRFGQRFPRTINHVLIADAERITAEQIDLLPHSCDGGILRVLSPHLRLKENQEGLVARHV